MVGESAVADRVRSAKQGDHDAFARLYRDHSAVIRFVVRDNVHNPQDIDDVVQEVFTRAYASLTTLRDDHQFTSWVTAIARRAAIDHRRRRVHSPPMVDVEDEAGYVSPEPSTQNLAEIRAELDAVRAAMNRLSRRDELALNLAGHLGFAPGEIAAVLGVTEGAAKVVVHRARQRLRTLLEEVPSTPGPAVPTAKE
jgi:RNA polymerase sigma-70 factor (ECF subfamily)